MFAVRVKLAIAAGRQEWLVDVYKVASHLAARTCEAESPMMQRPLARAKQGPALDARDEAETLARAAIMKRQRASCKTCEGIRADTGGTPGCEAALRLCEYLRRIDVVPTIAHLKCHGWDMLSCFPYCIHTLKHVAP